MPFLGPRNSNFLSHLGTNRNVYRYQTLFKKWGGGGSQAFPTRFMAAEPAERQGGREDQMSLEVGIYMRKRDCLNLVTARFDLPGNNDALMPNPLIE